MSDFQTTAGSDILSMRLEVDKGETSASQFVVFENPVAWEMKLVRVAFQLSNGQFTGGTPEQGQELQDEQWIEVREVDSTTFLPIVGKEAFTPIGGPYGFEADSPGVEEGSNYVAIDPIPVGGKFAMEIRLVVPLGAATEYIATGRFLVSWTRE